jgi:hypothetical protein
VANAGEENTMPNDKNTVWTPGGKPVQRPDDAKAYRHIPIENETALHMGMLEISDEDIRVTHNPYSDELPPPYDVADGAVYVLFNPWVSLSDLRMFLGLGDTLAILDRIKVRDPEDEDDHLRAVEEIREGIEDICGSMDHTENIEWTDRHPEFRPFYPYAWDDNGEGSEPPMQECVPRPSKRPRYRFLAITDDIHACCAILNDHASRRVDHFAVTEGGKYITAIAPDTDDFAMTAEVGDVVVYCEDSWLKVMPKDSFEKDYSIPSH